MTQDEKNLQILDSILDDDAYTFLSHIASFPPSESRKIRFSLTKYKLPEILRYDPTYASVCAFFGAVNCFNSLINFYPDGILAPEVKGKDEMRRSLVHFACASKDISIIQIISQNTEIKFYSVDRDFLTPVHYAAKYGNFDAIKYLYSNGVQLLNDDSLESPSPLSYACLMGHFDIVKFLMEANKPGIVRKVLNPPLAYALDYTHIDIPPPFYAACMGGHPEIVRYILHSKLFDIAQEIGPGSKYPMSFAIRAGSLDCIKELVTARLCVCDYRYNNPLSEAAAYGHIDIVTYLLTIPYINIDAKTDAGMTALSSAIVNHRIDIIKLLVAHGAMASAKEDELGDVFLKVCGIDNMEIVELFDKTYQIPYASFGIKYMQQAIILESYDLIEFLLKKGVTFDGIDIVQNDCKELTPFLEYLESKGLSIPGKKQTQIILNAIENEQFEKVSQLLAQGFKFDEKDIIDEINIRRIFKKKKQFNYILQRIHPAAFLICFLRETLEHMSDDPSQEHKREIIFRDLEAYLHKTNININDKIEEYGDNHVFARSIYTCCFPILHWFDEHGADYSKVKINFELLFQKLSETSTVENINQIFRFMRLHCLLPPNLLTIFFQTQSVTVRKYGPNLLIQEIIMECLETSTPAEILSIKTENGNILDYLVTFFPAKRDFGWDNHLDAEVFIFRKIYNRTGYFLPDNFPKSEFIRRLHTYSNRLADDIIKNTDQSM